MITIRDVSEVDVPDIVSLLRQTLGERGTLRTEEYWRWKHIRNPFGRSRVLLAFDGDRLVAVRDFDQVHAGRELVCVDADALFAGRKISLECFLDFFSGFV